jgi:hypothetical protein
MKLYLSESHSTTIPLRSYLACVKIVLVPFVEKLLVITFLGKTDNETSLLPKQSFITQ